MGVLGKMSMEVEKSPEEEGLSLLPAFVTIGIVVMGICWAAFGIFKYGVWVNNGPGGGFFSAVAGIGAASLAIYEFFFSPVRARPIGGKSLWPAGAMGLAILSIPILGMVLSMSVFILLWILLVEKKTWRQSILTGVGAGVALYLLFGLWLKVPFPQGLLLESMQ